MLLFRYFLFVFVVLKCVYADTECYDAAEAAISGCACHSTCEKCGYNFNPIEADDCLACADPAHVVTAVHADGTGTCAADVSTAVSSPPPEAPIQCFRSACDDSMGQDCCVPTPAEASSGELDEPARCKNGLFVHYTGDNCNRIGLFAGRDYVCCDRHPEGGQCKATGQYCDSSIGGDCCTSKNSGDESPRCKDNLAVTMTGADCYFGVGNDFVCCDGPQGPISAASPTITSSQVTFTITLLLSTLLIVYQF